MLWIVAVCSSPFPEVAESVQEELDNYRAQEDEVKRLKSIMVGHACAHRSLSNFDLQCSVIVTNLVMSRCF